jgi:hypothetical protein
MLILNFIDSQKNTLGNTLPGIATISAGGILVNFLIDQNTKQNEQIDQTKMDIAMDIAIDATHDALTKKRNEEKTKKND